jgi:group I intron endonuclease
MFAVYQVTNILNGDSYIGVTSLSPYTSRWTEHKRLSRRGSTTHFHNSIRKYGAEFFKWEILEEGWDPEIGKNIREPYWISVLKPEYNETLGGDGTLGHKHTEQFKAEQSRRHKGKQHTLGRKMTLEQSQHQSVWMKGKRNALGHRHTEQWKEESSKRHKGKQHTLGYKHTEEWKRSMSSKMKGRRQPEIACSNCGLVGGASLMKRYHLDNCEHK